MVSVPRLAGPYAAAAMEAPTVEQRVAGGPHERSDYREATAPLPVEPVPAGQHLQAVAPERAHCWVQDPDGAGDLPGVIVCQRRDPDGWRVQVTYVTHDGFAPATVTAWLTPDQVRPAGSLPS